MSIPEDKIRVTTILDKNLKTKLQELAKKDKRSLSTYIAIVLESHVKKDKNEKK